MSTTKNNTQHAPEPWVFDGPLAGTVGSSPIVAGKKIIARLAAYEFYNCTVEEMNANAERIVACVNACKGVSNEWLQSNAVQARIDEIAELKRIIADDMDRINELFEALREARQEWAHWMMAAGHKPTDDSAFVRCANLIDKIQWGAAKSEQA